MAKPIKHRDKWRIRWTDETGRRRSAVYDSKKEAAHQLRKREAETEDIKRGLRSPAPPKKTIGDLCDYWEDNRAPQKRSGHDDKSIIRCHLRPAFGQLLARQLNQIHVDTFVVARQHLSDKYLANMLTLLLSMLNLGKDIGWLTTVPRIRKPKVRIFSSDYRYLRGDGELRRFIRATRVEAPLVAALYLTAIYTGMRAGELAGLRWSDVDFDNRLIVVQRSYNGPTKAGDLRRVPILNALLPTLRTWRLQNDSELVFPNAAGRMFDDSARVFQDVLHRVLERAGFPIATNNNGRTKRHITFHDLRHTFASRWMLKNGNLFKLQKILGHKTVQMTMRYAHLAPDAFTEDHGRFDMPPEDDAVRTLRTGTQGSMSRYPETSCGD